MKKFFSKLVSSMVVAALCITMVTPSVFAGTVYQDGTYTGTGTGFMGPVTMEVVIADGKMTGINVVSHVDTPAIFETCIPALTDAIIASQSADVDVIASATYSSNGIMAAVKDALSKAETPEPVSVDKDALKALIEQVEDLNEADYTADSWSIFAEALSDANLMADSEEATQAQVDATKQALKSAFDALKLASAYDDGPYTATVAMWKNAGNSASAYAAALATKAALSVENGKVYLNASFSNATVVIGDDTITLSGETITEVKTESVPGSGSFDKVAEQVSYTTSRNVSTRVFKVEIPDLETATKFQMATTVAGTLSARFYIDVDTIAMDRSVLSALVTKANGLSEANYSAASWDEFLPVRAEMTEIAQKADLTQAEMAEAIETLQAAIDALASVNRIANSIDELKTLAAAATDGQTIYIAKDLDVDVDAYTSATISTTAKITIDGQGYSLDGKNREGFFYVRGGELTLKNMTVKNAAEYNRSGNLYAGSAVYGNSGNLNLENCTFINNAASRGNVVVGSNRTVNIVNCTFVNNKGNNAAAVSLGSGAKGIIANTIMVGSTTAAGVPVDDLGFTVSGGNPTTVTVADGGYNLIGKTANAHSAFNASTSTISETLNDYAGWLTAPTLVEGKSVDSVLPLLAASNSPALDKIPAGNEYMPSTDQRGVERPVNKKGDIGACETGTVPMRTSVSVSADKTRLMAGEEVKITINLGDLQDVNAYQMNIGYESNYLEFVSFEKAQDNTKIIQNTGASANPFRVIVGAPGTERFEGNQAIGVLTLKAKNGVREADVNVRFTGILLTKVEQGGIQEVKAQDVVTTIKVANRLKGDVDGNGKISLADLSLALLYFTKDSTDAEWSSKIWYADVNGDSVIDIADISYIAGLI